MSTGPAARAYDLHDCAGLPDEPALPGHIEHHDIAGGALSFREIIEAGRLLFSGSFNICDGQGRPATTGTGAPRAPVQPAFSRISAPDASSCADCHSDPRPGGGGGVVDNVFVLAQAMDPITLSIAPEFSNERNTLGMFGAGPIEMLAREMTADLERHHGRPLERQSARGALAGDGRRVRHVGRQWRRGGRRVHARTRVTLPRYCPRS